MKLQITIVGAGRYGRELVAPKYATNKNCALRGFIDRSRENNVPASGPHDSISVCRNVDEWLREHGAPKQHDIFDLAIHHTELPEMLTNLVSIGAKNFVLPKPLTLNAKQLIAIEELQQTHRLQCAIASQWHYSEVTRRTKSILANIKETSGLEHVYFNFSQHFTDEQLKKYSSRTALLPHILQIIYTTGLSKLHEPTIHIDEASHADLKFNIKDHETVIEVTSNLKTPQRNRIMKANSLEVDFDTSFYNAIGVKYPSLLWQGKKEEIQEDNLQVMIDAIIYAFHHHADIEEDGNILTFSRYLPIAKFQVALEHKTIHH